MVISKTNKMEKISNIREWIREINNHKYLIAISLIFLLIATILDLAAGNYVSRMGGVVAPDIILDNINPIDLEFIFVYGIMLIVSVLFLYPLFFKVKEFHKVISQFSLLIVVRGVFICLTHLKLPLDAMVVEYPWLISHLNFNNDLFFSGHVAIPFLGFLLFKDDKNKKIKYFFLGASILMGIVVLLMHLHYTIDVFSAFFITYGTFKIGEWFFKKIDDYQKKSNLG